MYITKHFFFKTIKIFLENYMVMVHDMVRMLAIHTGNKQEVSPESILQKYADQKWSWQKEKAVLNNNYYQMMTPSTVA